MRLSLAAELCSELAPQAEKALISAARLLEETMPAVRGMLPSASSFAPIGNQTGEVAKALSGAVESTTAESLLSASTQAAELGKRSIWTSPVSRIGDYTSSFSPNRTLRTMIAQDDRHVILNDKFPYSNLKGEYVDMDNYAVAPISTPLGCSHLATCGALAVTERKQNIHYLAHLMPSTRMGEIKASLTGFDLSSSEIYIMPGPLKSEVMHSVIKSLKGNPDALRNVRLVDFHGQTEWHELLRRHDRVKDRLGFNKMLSGETPKPEIVSYAGKLYLPPDMSQWAETASKSVRLP